MATGARIRLLTRLAARYALRHRGQTVRALLGLLVSTTVLTTGLGLGESIGTSLEQAALARYGDIDVVASSREPFPPTLADLVSGSSAVRPYAPRGAETLYLSGSASHPARDLAEGFATVRGVGPDEAAIFGPLRSPSGAVVAEPRSGEIVLTDDLAASLEARVGDTVRVRAASPPSFTDLRLATVNYTGVTGTPVPLPGLPGGVNAPVAFDVGDDALGLGAFALWPAGGGVTVTIEARSPTGISYANSSGTPPVFLLVEGPLAPGNWSVTVSAPSPIAYNGTAAVLYPPPTVVGGGVLIEGRVSAIVMREERSAYTGRPTALVPLADLQAAAGLTGRVNSVLWNVDGDADDAAAAIRETLPDTLQESVDVVAVKEEAARDAAQASAGITGFLLVMGGFTLVSGMLLAYALFSALVEERRGELGIARALGLTRGEVAITMTIEGGLYAALAALVGLALGMGLLVGFLTVLSGIIVAEGGPAVGYHVGLDTLVLAWGIGTLLPLVTIGLSSLRFARLDPARAIRGIPDDPKTRRRAGLVGGLLVAAAGGLAAIDPLGRLLGIPILLAGAAIVLSAFRQRLLALVAVAAAVAHGVWTLYTFTDFPNNETGEQLDPVLTLARGAVLALLLAAVAVASPAPYLLILRLWSRLRKVPRSTFVAIKYLTARPVSAGLTVAMIALVVVVVTVMGTLFLLFGAQIPDHEAGYEVIGESPVRLDGWPVPLAPDLAGAVERADFVYRHFELKETNFTLNGRPVGGGDSGIRTFLGVTPGFAEGNQYTLTRRAPQYADDRAAWDAVAAGDAVVVPYWYPDGEFQPGDRVGLSTLLGGDREYVVAGFVRTDYLFGAFVAADHVERMGFPTGSIVFVRARDGASPNSLAHRLTADYGEEGVTFISVPEEAARFAALAQAFVLVFESFLSLGLFVGLAATGFLAARAVHERARDIGTLRALGYEESDVRRAFVFESVLTSGIGLALGLIVGIVVAHSVWVREISDQGLPFVLPWAVLLPFIAAVLALAAFAAWRPARRAAQLPPAVAVRWVE